MGKIRPVRLALQDTRCSAQTQEHTAPTGCWFAGMTLAGRFQTGFPSSELLHSGKRQLSQGCLELASVVVASPGLVGTCSWADFVRSNSHGELAVAGAFHHPFYWSFHNHHKTWHWSMIRLGSKQDRPLVKTKALSRSPWRFRQSIMFCMWYFPYRDPTRFAPRQWCKNHAEINWWCMLCRSRWYAC